TPSSEAVHGVGNLLGTGRVDGRQLDSRALHDARVVRPVGGQLHAAELLAAARALRSGPRIQRTDGDCLRRVATRGKGGAEHGDDGNREREATDHSEHHQEVGENMGDGGHLPRTGGPSLPGQDEAGGHVDGNDPPPVDGDVHQGEQRRRPQDGDGYAPRQQGVVDEAPEEGLLGHCCQRTEDDHAQDERLWRVSAADDAPQHKGADPDGEDGQGGGRPRRNRRPPRPEHTADEQHDEDGGQRHRGMGAVPQHHWPQDEQRTPRCDDGRRRPRANQHQAFVHWTMKITAAVGRFWNGRWSMATNSAVSVCCPGFSPCRSWVVLYAMLTRVPSSETWMWPWSVGTLPLTVVWAAGTTFPPMRLTTSVTSGPVV